MILWDHHHICGPSVTKLCWSYVVHDYINIHSFTYNTHTYVNVYVHIAIKRIHKNWEVSTSEEENWDGGDLQVRGEKETYFLLYILLYLKIFIPCAKCECLSV